MLYVELPKRGCDDYGSGDFGAPRGKRTHNGVDYSCYPGTRILACCAGKVTKLGHPYEDDPETPLNEFAEFRYVEVTDGEGNRHRYFYVRPLVRIGDESWPGKVLGEVQDLTIKYGGDEKRKPITNHVHYEVIGWNGEYLDPENPRIGPRPKDNGPKLVA